MKRTHLFWELLILKESFRFHKTLTKLLVYFWSEAKGTRMLDVKSVLWKCETVIVCSFLILLQNYTYWALLTNYKVAPFSKELPLTVVDTLTLSGVNIVNAAWVCIVQLAKNGRKCCSGRNIQTKSSVNGIWQKITFFFKALNILLQKCHCVQKLKTGFINH